MIDDEDHEPVDEWAAAVDAANDSGTVCTRVPHPVRPSAGRSTVRTVKAGRNAIGARSARVAVSGDLGLGRRARGSRMGMLAIVAAVVFGIAFVINATGRATDPAFSVTGLLLLGLTLLALRQAGIGGVWVRRR